MKALRRYPLNLDFTEHYVICLVGYLTHSQHTMLEADRLNTLKVEGISSAWSLLDVLIRRN